MLLYKQIQILLLGIIQGITEFLPISSSGHLVILQSLFGLKEMIFYDILLHFSTMFAVIVLFFKEIISYCKRIKILFAIILLTIPTGIIGLFIRKYFSFVFEKGVFASLFIIITGFWLYLSEKIYLKNPNLKRNLENFGIFRIFLIGVAQGIAVLPGISRSGATLGLSLILNLDRKEAVKFIFVASLPAILGATILEFKEYIISNSKLIFDFNYIYGMFLAFVLAILSMKFLIKTLNNSKLKYFSYYCWGIGMLFLIYFLKNNL